MRPVLRVFVMALLLTTLLSFAVPASAASPGAGFVVVRWGDTLYSIAARAGTTVDAMVRANGLPNPNFIWAGQRLIIPGSSPAPAPGPVNPPTTPSSIYVVVRGDTLATIAARFGTTIQALMNANRLFNPNFIYTGQRLSIPGRSNIPAPQPGPAPAPQPGPVGPAPTPGKWIDIDISAQTISAYMGNTRLKSVLVSTGVSWHPTPMGRFKVYMKVYSQTMSGGSGAERYYLPGVPWVMYFTGAYAIHGTYWHRNFGTPMSHGCVNLTIEDAKWFYQWADMGTPVVVHP